MLEFYQAYSDYRDLMDLSQEMITQVAEAVTGARQVQYGEHLLDFDHWHRLSMKEAIFRFWPDSLNTPSEEDLHSVDRLRLLVGSLHAHFEPSDGAGKLLVNLFETVAEDHLIQPTIVYDYPAEVSPLSKTKPEDPATVEQFELYLAGMEIGTAYSELNDPAEQKARFEEQLLARGRGEEEAHDMDVD
jgi:lysyl-tRNA synthetase class 2